MSGRRPATLSEEILGLAAIFAFLGVLMAGVACFFSH